jgi:putative spermidine/putrescine transport system permease protein
MTADTREIVLKAVLAVYFGVFLLFLYGPAIIMGILSFQDARGGATFPARGLVSFHWYDHLASSASAPVHEAAVRSLTLAVAVGLIVAVLSLSLGMAFRRLRLLSGPLLYLVLLSLMTPGLLLSLGMTIWWELLGLPNQLYPTVLGVQVVWALPFGFLVMLSLFNRYDAAIEEGAHDLGASPVDTFWRVTLPIIWPGIFAATLLGFTLSWNEVERSLLISPVQTLPLEIWSEITVRSLDPSLYSLGTLTTVGTWVLVMLVLVAGAVWARRTTRAQAVGEEEAGMEPPGRRRLVEAARG